MQPEKRKSNPTDYLANERTFLAWVRTSIGIMAFGFVVVKFSLFVRQLSVILDTEGAVKLPAEQAHHSAIVGVVLVILGILTIVFAYFRYRSTNKQLDTGVYKHSTLTVSLLAITIFLISMLLVIYLLKTA